MHSARNVGGSGDTQGQRTHGALGPLNDRKELTDDRAAMPVRDPYLLAQVRESFGSVVYSPKNHEKQADICFNKHRWQQGVLVALTASAPAPSWS